MKPLETVSRTEILALNKFLRVERHEVRLSNGRVIPDWGWIDSPDYVTICAVDREGRFLGFHQAKYAMGDHFGFGPPGGYLEPGENPLEAAQRELLEETGYASERWIPLAQCVSDANRGNGTGHFFLALDCAPESGPRPASDDVEDAELRRLDRSELEAALVGAPALPAPWLLCFTLGMRQLDAVRAKAAPILVVAGVIRNARGQVLVARRARGQSNAGLWEFPGGKRESGETEAECLAREIHEEFGAAIDVERPLTVTECHTGGRAIKLVAWTARAEDDAVFTPTVHSEIQWIDPSALPALREAFSPADLPIIDAVIARVVRSGCELPCFPALHGP